jgi:hypothetical protein
VEPEDQACREAHAGPDRPRHLLRCGVDQGQPGNRRIRRIRAAGGLGVHRSFPAPGCEGRGADLAGSGVNLLLCATTSGDRGVVAFIADDEATAQAVLNSAGIGYQVRPAVAVKMDNRPGVGAAAFRKLADAGVNVDLLMPVLISATEFYAVICADDAAAAEAALGGQVISK